MELVQIMRSEQFQYASESGKVDPLSEEDVRRWYHQNEESGLRNIMNEQQESMLREELSQSKQASRLYFIPSNPMADGKDETGVKVKRELLLDWFDHGYLKKEYALDMGAWFLMKINHNGAMERIVSLEEMDRRLNAVAQQRRIQKRLVTKLVNTHKGHRLENAQLKELNRRVERIHQTIKCLERRGQLT